MKKLLVVLLVTLFMGKLIAQQTKFLSDQRNCGTMEYTEMLKQNDPTYASKLDDVEKFVQNYVANHPEELSKIVITIPVVVHIIYRTTFQNITDAGIQLQIANLNTDFAGLNTHSMYAFSPTLKANTELQFCLATVDPQGNPTTGITRTATTITSFSTGTNMKYTSQGGHDAWNTNKYLNIWVCNLGNQLDGFAEFPTNPLTNTFGVVLHFESLVEATHEIGHCFNLLHPYGGDKCENLDFCDDTPDEYGVHNGTIGGVITDSCNTTSPGLMYMNFMAYDTIGDVLANFTPDQAIRMQACFAPGGPLEELGSRELIIPEYVTEQNIKLYPNPATGSVYISGVESHNATVELYDIYGKLHNTITKTQGSQINIDLNGFAKGVYYLKIKSLKGEKVEKLLVY